MSAYVAWVRTGQRWRRVAEADTAPAAFRALREWMLTHGVPVASAVLRRGRHPDQAPGRQLHRGDTLAVGLPKRPPQAAPGASGPPPALRERSPADSRA